jgi:hypothetical protein
MTFSKYQGREALKETANIVLLTILLVASGLTLDWLLLVVGLAAELAYLCWASCSSRYTKRLGSRTQWVVSEDPFLDGLLIVVTVAGFVVIFFFGFGKHLLSHPWPYLTHAEGWDVGAIAWTGFFLVYYTWKFPFTNNRKVDKAIISIIQLCTVPLLLAAIYSIWVKRPVIHVIFVLLIGLCFLWIDYLISSKHPDPVEKSLSKESLKWADWPMVATFSVLILYLGLHRDTENPDVFVAGVVACQLLISNAVFIATEFGELRSSQTTSVPEQRAP